VSLLQQHLAYIERVRGHCRILAYSPPCCGVTTETTAPGGDDVWDSLTVCPHCGVLGMKIVTHDKVAIELLEDTSR
jgi:hypothetical protein